MTEQTRNESSESVSLSSAEREQVHDLRDQVAALIALTVKDRGNVSRIISFIVAFTAFVAAIGSLVGSYQSLYVSIQTSQTQREIQERQKIIDARQDVLDVRDRRGFENTRIGNLWIANPDISCGAIPADEDLKWQSYCTCIFGEHCTRDHNFRQVEDQKRLQCLRQINICKKARA
jgi:hypothetical protein